jgi:hypothetical protein
MIRHGGHAREALKSVERQFVIELLAAREETAWGVLEGLAVAYNRDFDLGNSSGNFSWAQLLLDDMEAAGLIRESPDPEAIGYYALAEPA